MKGFCNRGFLVLMAVSWLSSCATIKQFIPITEEPQLESQRATVAMASLDDLDEIDSYIKIDNDLLGLQISEALEAQAALSGIFSLDRIKVRFARQAIFLEARLQIFNGEGNTIGANISGDVMLAFSGDRLIWLPRFDALHINPPGFRSTRAEADELTLASEAQWLEKANHEIADALIVLDRNVVRVSPLPLGHIEVGAELTSLDGIAASGSHMLGGVYTVAGSAILVDPFTTSIALDLGFVPNISTCPSDVYVSRSTFAREIQNREPLGVSRFLEPDESRSHFFTEISGATQSTSIVHIWFADGQPVWLEELAVEPSYRWRTWSSLSVEDIDARHWEVIVVEKQTGCILHSQTIRVNPAIAIMQSESEPDFTTYMQYRDEFMARTNSFSIQEQRPDIAFIETRREFVRQVLRDSLKDIRVVANFDTRNIAVKRLSGVLNPFSSEDIACQEQTCPPPRDCGATFSRCIQKRDNRVCSQCLFRNPLNNRCVDEGNDPICEAARTARNAVFESRYQSCLAGEAEELQACQRLADQESQSCELEAGAELAACEAARQTVIEFADSGPFANVELKLGTEGGLSIIFSGFELEGDLENIRLNIALSGALDLSGSVRFAPHQRLGPLAECINSWQKSFDAKVLLPYEAQSMIGSLETTSGQIYSDWSGFVLAAAMNPSPLEAMFVESPGLLADCRIGLTVGEVVAAISGEIRAYLAGEYSIEIQPQASRVVMADATISFGNREFTAAPLFSAKGLTYVVEE
ncbi:MAG: DUF2914 domain-containing protein [Xanthomonadales bacterium]|nr:DUF2914 domain-containing protein [Xanthomonadales bacterium]